MRAVVQRTLSASVTVDGEVVGATTEPGLLVYLGVTHDDGPADVAWTARKIWELRLLREERSASDVGAPVLVVSQFTLYGDARKGRRPSFVDAAPPDHAEAVFQRTVEIFRETGLTVETGRFQAYMMVSIRNDGPFTIMLDTDDRRRPRREHSG